MTWTLLFALAVMGYLTYRNYQLEKRWRALRYCWLSMSDFAAARSSSDEQWRDVIREQTAFMGRIGATVMRPEEVRVYELALLERDLPVLTEHKVF